ncbi:MAG: hypothetical protein ABIR78_13830 [Ferruginibacter sp.]
MKAKRIFTRQVLGLDYRVLRVILAMMIIALGLLSYRLIDKKECTPVNFLIKTITVHTDSSYMAGETLSFIASANENEINWDFGDNSPKVTGQYVTHKFLRIGTFNITASTGTSCDALQAITIKPAEDMGKKGDQVISGEEIIGKVSTLAGSEETFTCMVTATSYEWSIPNYPKMTANGSTAKFRFPNAGKFLVQVTLDHDRTKRFSKEITVEPVVIEKSHLPENIKPLIPEGVKPLPDPEPANTSVKISDAVFTDYLSKVIDKKMTAPDFDKYLCYKGETKAVLNGDLVSFNALCDEISGKKRRKLIIGRTRIKITSATMRRDNDGCVNIVEVKYH